jgi:hypothetical protein
LELRYKEFSMRNLAYAVTLGFALAIAGCTQAEQDKTQANANEAAADVKTSAENVGQDVKEGAQKAGAEIKDVTSDPDVKAAANEAKDALKGLGSAIKDAAKDDDATTPGTTKTTVTTTTTTTEKK